MMRWISIAALLPLMAARADSPPAPDWQVITNAVSNLCLGVRGVDNHRPGTGVEIYWCNPGNGDRGRDYFWTFEPADEGYFFFKNRVSGLCLGVRGVDNHQPGTEAEVYHCKPPGGDAGKDGHWKIVAEPDGFKRIENRVSKLCLTVRGKQEPGAAVEVNACDDKEKARWARWRFQGP